MWRAYKYVYYWLYTWNRSLWGDSDVPQFNAITGMSLSLLALLFSILSLFYILFDIRLILNEIPKTVLFIFFNIVLGIHYFLFMHRNKYKKIEQEFKNESKEERKSKGRWVLVYAFGSLGLFIFLMFFGIWIKHG